MHECCDEPMKCIVRNEKLRSDGLPMVKGTIIWAIECGDFFLVIENDQKLVVGMMAGYLVAEHEYLRFIVIEE